MKIRRVDSRAKAAGQSPAAGGAAPRVTERFPVENLDCSACGGNLRTSMRSLTGVIAVAPNVAAREVAVTFDPSRVSPAVIKAHLNALGLGCA